MVFSEKCRYLRKLKSDKLQIGFVCNKKSYGHAILKTTHKSKKPFKSYGHFWKNFTFSTLSSEDMKTVVGTTSSWRCDVMRRSSALKNI